MKRGDRARRKLELETVIAQREAFEALPQNEKLKQLADLGIPVEVPSTPKLTKAEKALLFRLLTNERFSYLQHCHDVNAKQFANEPEKAENFLGRGMEYAKAINTLMEVLGIDQKEQANSPVGHGPGNMGRAV